MLDTAFKSLDQVAREMETMAELAVEENEHVIVDMNTENLFSGKNAKGQSLDSIGGSYSPFTVEMKKLKGQPYDRVTLKDTGDFYEGFFVKRAKMGWEIDSKDEKTQKLKNDWGEDIFGNTEADEKEINEEYILPELIEHALDNLEL